MITKDTFEPSQQEIERRYANTRAAMAKHDLDALIVSGSEYTGFEGAVRYMCGFRIPGTGEVLDLFGRGGGEDLARELSVPFLGRVPLDMAVREAGDQGRPTVLSAPGSDAGLALARIGDDLLAALDGLPARR